MIPCDIIIPIWNQLECTTRCIESIGRNTKTPYRLILIDNASDKETRDYLERLKLSFGFMKHLLLQITATP